jgi:cytolysin-activating lysine-acyltransferase
VIETGRAANCPPITEPKRRGKERIDLVGPDAMREPVGAAIRLMILSDLHRRWTVSDLDRLIVPPIEMGQCLFAIKERSPIAFVSWALFSEEVSMVFANHMRPLRREDWQSGTQLWIIDFIGTFGFVPEIVQMLREYGKQRYPCDSGAFAFAIRYKDRNRVRRLSRWAR